MNLFNKILIITISIFALSCAKREISQLQVFTTEFENGTMQNQNIVFEDSNLTIFYDLWSNGGNIGFSIFNKTDSVISVDLAKTFYISNGASYDYFKNRTYANSATNSYSITEQKTPYLGAKYNTTEQNVNSSMTTVSEKAITNIPPRATKSISEYKIATGYFFNCDDLEKKYDKLSTPMKFSNFITYYAKGKEFYIENKFYLSSAKLVSTEELYDRIDLNECGNKLQFPIWSFKKLAPNMFYID